MNIESTISVTKTTNTSSTSSSTGASSNNSSSTSFKDELDSVKAQENSKKTEDTKKAEDSQNAEDAKTHEADAENVKNAQKDSEEKNSQQIAKDELNEENAKAEENLLKQQEYSNPINELNSKIATLNDLKNNGFNSKSQGVESKADDKLSNKNDYCQTLKMNNNDITFFVNLVENQQMIAQNNPGVNPNMVNSDFTDIKSEATQKTVQISQTLLDAINKSAQTGKSFRVDFDNDIAVIMKVDKQGVLSANFIPGSAAVENYLRNNIASLRQNFDNQNLPYNELSYSQQQKQDKEQQNKNNKENKNE